MNTEINKKIELKEKFLNFYNNNKFKLYFFLTSVIVILILLAFFKVQLEKKNEEIAENYVRAGSLLSSGKKEDSLNIYENIIMSKNNFYSILALNNILEESLTKDEKKIISLFNIVESSLKSSEQIDLLRFKKALYLIKNGKNSEGNEILKKLINKESQFKSLSEEALVE